jgi:hypothetical protein
LGWLLGKYSAETEGGAQFAGLPYAGLRRHEAEGPSFKAENSQIFLAYQWRTSPFAKGGKKEKRGGSESVFCVLIKNRHRRTLLNSLA